jgi:hypothetical protein
MKTRIGPAVLLLAVALVGCQPLLTAMLGLLRDPLLRRTTRE